MTHTPHTVWIGGPPGLKKTIPEVPMWAPNSHKGQADMEERNAFIRKARADGNTLKDIAFWVGLTSLSQCSKIARRAD